jgi:hypothetical protein
MDFQAALSTARTKGPLFRGQDGFHTIDLPQTLSDVVGFRIIESGNLQIDR